MCTIIGYTQLDYYYVCLQFLQPGVSGAHGVVARPHVVVADSKELEDVLEETLVLEPAASSETATLRAVLNVSYYRSF